MAKITWNIPENLKLPTKHEADNVGKRRRYLMKPIHQQIKLSPTLSYFLRRKTTTKVNRIGRRPNG